MPQPANSPVTLLTAANEMEAAIIVGALADGNVEASTVGGFTAGFIAEAPGRVSILVRQQDLSRARDVLAESQTSLSDEPMPELSHFDASGASRMVDVGEKMPSRRVARASGQVCMQPATLKLILDRKHAKGDVLEVARLAGIMAAKRTADLIPLCHPLPIDAIRLDLRPDGDDRLQIEATVEVTAKTGVEMEALTAVSVAALTIYDMCKSVDRAMSLSEFRLEEKTGGASGHFVRGE